MTIRLDVLGTATPYPRPGNACSGYLVTGPGARIWLDAGTGTLAELQRYVRPDELDAIWVSHAHADHAADLLTAYYALRFADLRPAAPIPLYGPPGLGDRLARFLGGDAAPSPVHRAFAVHELYDGHRVEVGGVTLTARAVEHDVPAFAVRIAAGDVAVAYSGDTAPCAALTDLAAGCDLLLCEADGARPDEAHHTPEDAGATATTAAVGRLVLTHVGPFLTGTDAVERAAAVFRGPVTLATPGEALVV
ncbi:MAG TPA: MBL fold metallo-hydrolase [Actinocatenispora sp.]